MNTNDLTISEDDVVKFKTVHCDENDIIKHLIKDKLTSYLHEPILDVGAGIGEILTYALPEAQVTYLDVFDFSASPLPANHKRLTGDFLEFTPEAGASYETLFLGHVLQFIDSDRDKLDKAISRLNAKTIVSIDDMNNDLLGEIMRYSLENFPNANPEVALKNFPVGYKLVKSEPLTATLKSPNFNLLAKQCLYLMDVEVNDKNMDKMKNFLTKKLDKPEFTINQAINIYALA